ncbi:MAG: rhodanese-like domain-containing protein [Ethanoligenens sp.]
MFDFLFGQVPKNAISPKQAKERLDSGDTVLLLDVRTREEYKGGHIPNSISLPLDQLKTRITHTAPDKSAEIIVYCLSGGRAAQACGMLAAMGYTDVHNLGGINAWPYAVTR